MGLVIVSSSEGCFQHFPESLHLKQSLRHSSINVSQDNGVDDDDGDNDDGDDDDDDDDGDGDDDGGGDDDDGVVRCQGFNWVSFSLVCLISIFSC